MIRIAREMRPVLALMGLVLLIVLSTGLWVIHALRPAVEAAAIPAPRFEIPIEIPHCLPPEMETVYVHVTPGAVPDPVVVWKHHCGEHDYLMLPEVDPRQPEVPVR